MATRSRVFVVTPCFNAAETIDRTISSVVAQEGDFDLVYHLQDGGSSDETVRAIQRWQSLIESGSLPVFCNSVRLTWESSPDEGIYDAICRGVDQFDIAPDDWMGWINADDILMPGTAALLAQVDAAESGRDISWVVGGVGVMNHGTFLAHGPRPHSAELLRFGLADGRHWDYVQQEGVFFRHKLWRELDLEADFRRMRYAGDWNLWRRLAARHEAYQVDRPLGGFRLREGQTSARFRDRYEVETEELVPLGRRLHALRALSKSPPYRKIIALTYPDGRVFTREESLEGPIRLQLAQMVGPLHDDHWSWPPTERRAFEAVRDTAPLVSSAAYVAFPWATLIDLIEAGSPRAPELRAYMQRCARTVTPAAIRTTVCQHPRMLAHRDLFEACGVTDVFWSHATQPAMAWPGTSPITVRPFPQHPSSADVAPFTDDEERELLFSFVRDRDVPMEAGEVARWIADTLAKDARGLVAAPMDESPPVRGVLARSTFALCPPDANGGAPALWEALGAGAIPVIFGDPRGLPGAAALWREAVVAADPTAQALAALPEQLASLAADRDLIARKRRALRQIQLLYGAENLIHDLRKFYLENGGSAAWSSPASSKPSPGERPARGRAGRIRVHLHGRHSHQTPLAQADYRKHFAPHIELVADPRQADLVVAGREVDLRVDGHALHRAKTETPSLKFVVLSEQPLAAPVSVMQDDDDRIEFSVIGHHNSDVFDFRRLPYALTKSDETIARYNFLFGRAGARHPRELVRWWTAAPLHAAFVARRAPDLEDWADEALGVQDLSRYRTLVAERLQGAAILQLGPGWSGPTLREAPADWRLDKLASLQRRAFMVSALEAVHQASYITENLFDAFACDAAPIYFAAPVHRIHELLPGGFINLYGLSADAAADLLARQAPSVELAEAWLGAREHLAALFCDPVSLRSERERLAGRTLAALEAVLNGTWQDRARPSPPPRAASSLALWGNGPPLVRRARIVRRRADQDYRQLTFEVLEPRFSEVAPNRIFFKILIMRTGEFGVQVERGAIAPAQVSEQLDWRAGDGAALPRLTFFVNTTTKRAMWSIRASDSLHQFVLDLAQHLPQVLDACRAQVGVTQDWTTAAAALAEIATQIDPRAPRPRRDAVELRPRATGR